MNLQTTTGFKLGKLIGLISLVLILSCTLILFIPWNIKEIRSNPQPVQTYNEAKERIEHFILQQDKNLLRVCGLQLMTHGEMVDTVIVLVHGYTSCPQQFNPIGQMFFKLGYNVLIAPLPHHGLNDLMTEEHSKLTAEELADYSDEVADIAHGLGKHRIMMGLSCGGVVTAWAAQTRKDIDLAVVVSPALGFKAIPTALTSVMMNLYAFLPDSYGWWNPLLKEKTQVSYAYPRYSKRALSNMLRLGFATKSLAKREAPSAGKIIMVTNENDQAVNNVIAKRLLDLWKSKSANASAYEFPANDRLVHDLIEPNLSEQRIDLVYPRLINLVRAKN